jgi:hypothetical protein
LKIESQNKKVREAHDALVTKQKKVRDISALDSSSSGLSTASGTNSNALMKATTALEKSTTAFERVVDGAISLVGTGSGKVPLLLPPTRVDTQLESTRRK